MANEQDLRVRTIELGDDGKITRVTAQVSTAGYYLVRRVLGSMTPAFDGNTMKLSREFALELVRAGEAPDEDVPELKDVGYELWKLFRALEGLDAEYDGE